MYIIITSRMSGNTSASDISLASATALIEEHYKHASTNPGDIFEHLPTLCAYARQCETIAELGVSVCISTWAFVKGLLENQSATKRLIGCDVAHHPNMEFVKTVSKGANVDVDFHIMDDLKLDFKEPVDLCFIDTWHVYAQLKRELAKFAPLTRKYIIMHDTTVDAEYGESIRGRHDVYAQSQQTGFGVDEICKGLRYAVEEFIAEHKDEWVVELVKTNNNGLTVLRRIGEPKTKAQ